MRYNRKIEGVITQIYGSQRHHAKQRGHALPNYTKAEFTTWFYNNGGQQLYDTWSFSGFQTLLKPSADRLDNSLSYTFDNMQLTTWEVNNRNGYRDNTVKVRQSTKDGVWIADYPSITAAGIGTGLPTPNISSNCSGRLKTVGGFIFTPIYN